MNVKINLIFEKNRGQVFPMFYVKSGRNDADPVLVREPGQDWSIYTPHPDIAQRVKRVELNFPKISSILSEVFSYSAGQLGGESKVIVLLAYEPDRLCYTHMDMSISIPPQNHLFRLVADEVARLSQKYDCIYEETTSITRRGQLKGYKFLLRLPLFEQG